MTRGIVLHSLALRVAHIAVHRAVHLHVGVSLHVERQPVPVCAPFVVAQIVLIDRRIHHDVALVGTIEGIVGNIDNP